MDQLNFDPFLNGEKELIICEMSNNLHWIRITNGHTPKAVADRVHFTLNGYDYLYENTVDKEETIKLFDGDVNIVTWEEALMNV